MGDRLNKYTCDIAKNVSTNAIDKKKLVPLVVKYIFNLFFIFF